MLDREMLEKQAVVEMDTQVNAMLELIIKQIGPDKFLEIVEKFKDMAIRLRDKPVENWLYKDAFSEAK